MPKRPTRPIGVAAWRCLSWFWTTLSIVCLFVHLLQFDQGTKGNKSKLQRRRALDSIYRCQGISVSINTSTQGTVEFKNDWYQGCLLSLCRRVPLKQIFGPCPDDSLDTIESYPVIVTMFGVASNNNTVHRSLSVILVIAFHIGSPRVVSSIRCNPTK